jgi:hypothetical protein
VLALVAAAWLSAAADPRLVGVWRYVREVDTRPDGSPAPSVVLSDVEGLLVYTADGYVFVTLMPKGRTWTSGDATQSALRETVENGTAYAGRYEVDAAAGTVTHVPVVSMEPEYAGKRLVRKYALRGGTLELSGSFEYGGETIRFVIEWARADAAPAR